MKLPISIGKQWYFQKAVGNWLFTDRVQVSRSQALLKINLKYITYLNVKRQTKTVENKIHDESWWLRVGKQLLDMVPKAQFIRKLDFFSS